MKKFLSLVMAVVLVAMMSVASFAATTVYTFDELETEVGNGGDIVLGADNIEISTSLRVKTDVNLDLNGYTLIGPHNYDGGSNLYAFIVESGTLTLDDTSDAQTGEIECKYSGIETKGGSFVMNGGKITAADKYMAVAVVNYGGSVTINDGVIDAYDTAVTTMAYFADSATTEIKGGEINLVESENNYAVFEVGGSYNTGSADVSISAGTINSNNNDTFAYSNSSGEVAAEVSGGTFSNPADVEEYLADGAVIDSETGVVTTPEAEVEEEEDNDEPTPEEIERDRIVAAIKDAADGETVTLDVKKLNVVSRFIADAMSGKNVNLEYTLGEETITVNGRNVPKTPAYRVWYSLELFSQFA